MNRITFVLQALLCLSLMLAGLAATLRVRWLEPLAPLFPQAGIRRFMVAALFWLAGAAVVAGMLVPFASFFAACLAWVASIFLALRVVPLKITRLWLLPALMTTASVVVAIAQPLGLKVLALPQADDLPFEPARARVVKTYDEGLWFEGIAAGADGTLYLAGNRGIDFSRSDYYRDAQGELIVRKPDGSERVLFKTTRGNTAGVIAIASDGTLYMASHGEASTIWRIDSQGNGQRLAKFPGGAWPNGLDFGPDGMLYTPDSHLGLIWRVNPGNGRTDVALRDPALLARPFIALAPGANGLHFMGRDLLVTVSDRTTVLKYPMDDQGHFGPAAVMATRIPGDDFAMGKDGSLFITTHPYNTLVRVTPDGRRTIIGKAEQHIVGATDAVFGKGSQDRDTLYVVTDGGAFDGGSKTQGDLVAVQPYGNR